jgi:glycosyltransferase involved in cell wall biosynthesis
MKILKRCLLFLMPFQWFSCTNGGDFGGNYTDDCKGSNTEIHLEARDFYTNELLGGIPFKIYRFSSLNWGSLFTEISAFKTTQNGSARDLFTHETNGYYAYYLKVDPIQNNYLTNSSWGIPAGCASTYNIRLKPVKQLQISLKNNLGNDLESFYLSVGNVSPYKRINGIYEPENLQLGDFRKAIFIDNETEDLTFICLPEEPTKINISYLKNGISIQKDTTFLSSRTDETFTLNLN